jgi:hypothetical protein
VGTDNWQLTRCHLVSFKGRARRSTEWAGTLRAASHPLPGDAAHTFVRQPPFDHGGGHMAKSKGGARTILISGCGSGIGKHMALALAAAGHRLMLLDIDAAALERTTCAMWRVGSVSSMTAPRISARWT